MSVPVPIAPAAPGSHTTEAPPGGAPPNGPPFGEVLDRTVARTASAEGQPKSGEPGGASDGAKAVGRSVRKPASPAPNGTVAARSDTPNDPTVLQTLAVVTPLAIAGPVTPSGAPQPDARAGAEAATGADALAPAGGLLDGALTAQPQPGAQLPLSADASASPSAHQVSAVLVSAPGVSVRESVPTVQAGEGAKAGDARPDDGPTQSVVALPAVGVLAAPGADAPDAGTQGDRAPLGNHTLATLASSHGRPGASGPEVIADPSLAPGSHPSSGALDQSVTDAALAPAPSASAATAPLSAGTPVTLAQLPQTVSLAIQLGNSGAASIVRIRLTPPELGGIRVSITQTADGLVARVLADHAGAAQTLAQSGDELRRSLANAGVSLLRLDIGASGEQSLGERGGAPGAKEQSRTGEPALLEQSDSATAPPRTIALSNGVLVDILA